MILPILDAAIASTRNTKCTRSSNELADAKRALLDVPLRTTGVVKHAISALEGVTVHLFPDCHNMDQVLKRSSLGGTEKDMVRSLWAYANDRARHIDESKLDPSYEDALFALHISCAVIMRPVGSRHCTCCGESSLTVEVIDHACITCSRPTHGCDICNKCTDFVFKHEGELPDGSEYLLRWCRECADRDLRWGCCAYPDDPEVGYHDCDCTCHQPEYESA